MAMTFWISVLMYITYKIFQFERCAFPLWQFHLACWGYPVIAIALLFTVAKLSTTSSDIDTICNFAPRVEDKEGVNAFIAFFVLVEIGTQVLNLYFILTIMYKYYVLKLMNDKTIWKIVSNLALYGFFLLAYIIGYIAMFNVSPTGYQTEKSGRIRLNPLEKYVYISNILIGALFGLIFLFSSKESRKRWLRLFDKLTSCKKPLQDADDSRNSTTDLVINPSHLEVESTFDAEKAREFSFEPYHKDDDFKGNNKNVLIPHDDSNEDADFEGITNDKILKEGDQVITL
jgi:hypothetical protein